MSQVTCWTLIRGAASGDRRARADFSRLYQPVVHAYLSARWHRSPILQELDDALQEVFLECFREGGALQKREGELECGFRAYLLGVVRNVARRFEKKRSHLRERQGTDSFQAEDIPAEEESRLSAVFDRSWAEAIMREAADRQQARAEKVGDAAMNRLKLLRLRFEQDLPIREIARMWGADPAFLHHEFAQARLEFKAALVEVVSFHDPHSRASAELECGRLLGLLA